MFINPHQTLAPRPPPSLLSKAALLFLCLWLFYGALINSRDLESYTLQHAGAESIVERGTFDVSGSLTPRLRYPGDTFWHEGRLLAAKQPGQFALSAIPYSIAEAFGVTYRNNYRLAAALVTWGSADILLALSAACIFLFCARILRYSIRVSLFSALSYALCSTSCAYVGVLHHDLMATAFFVFALYLFEESNFSLSTFPDLARGLSGIFLGFSICTSMLIAPIALGFLIYASMLTCRGEQGWDKAIAPLTWYGWIALGLSPLLIYNYYYFGNPFLPANVAGDFSDTFFKPSISLFRDHLSTYLGLGALSALKYSPLLYFGIGGAWCFSKTHSQLRNLVIGASILHCLYIFNIETIGHCQFGPRYLLPLGPLMALGLAALVDASSRGGTRKLFACFLCLLAVFSFLVNVVGSMGGTMYCELQEYAFTNYLSLPSPIIGNAYPLRQFCILVLLLTLGRFLERHFRESRALCFCIEASAEQPSKRSHWPAIILASMVGMVYYYSNPSHSSPYNYTYRIAEALLYGQLGLGSKPPSWLNEMIPLDGFYYSAFPLGSALCMLPLLVIESLFSLPHYQSNAIAAILGASISYFSFLISRAYFPRTLQPYFLSIFIPLATWLWANLSVGGAWQIALGFAVVGELGALYFTLARPIPVLAGFFFAVAFGNRTEILLCAPFFLYLQFKVLKSNHTLPLTPQATLISLSGFCVVPFILGCATLAYNQARFGSITDFGYTRIPGVLNEPWYRAGLFSLSAISINCYEMLLSLWRIVPRFPYLIPSGFGGSIVLACPMLLLILRPGTRHYPIKVVAWAALFLLTSLLWTHGNPGGWQISYRYAVVWLPWALLLLLESARTNPQPLEIILMSLSVGICGYSTYLFHWTNYIQP